MKFNVGDRVVYDGARYTIQVVWEDGCTYDILHLTGTFGHSGISESKLDFDKKHYREIKLNQLGI